MKKVYIKKLAYYSKLAHGIEELKRNFEDLLCESGENKETVSLDEVEDLQDILGKSGLKSKDLMTKTSSYIAKKIMQDEKIDKCDDVGIIYVTEFGNMKSMVDLSQSVKDSEEPISSQLFPNATVSTSAVTASLYLKARGLNITINAGILGLASGIKMAYNYLSTGKLSTIIILMGDDYQELAIYDLKKLGVKSKRFLSTVSGILLSNDPSICVFEEQNYKLEVNRVCISNNIDAFFNEYNWFNNPKQITQLAGYINDNKIPEYFKEMKNLNNWFEKDLTYIGPNISFMQIFDSVFKFSNNDFEKANIITMDNFKRISCISLARGE